MNLKILKISFLIVLSILIIINIATIKAGHNWGGDFSHYIIHAKNLIDAKPYCSGIMLDLPLCFTPGFAFVIAPVIKIFGLNLMILKLINVLFWYLSLIPLYCLFRTKIQRSSLLFLLMLFAVLYNFFIFKQNIVSDVVFLFFSFLSLFLFSFYSSEKEKKSGNIFSLFLCAALISIIVRSAGLFLFLSAMFYFLFVQVDFKRFCIVLFTSFLGLFVQYLFMGKTEGFLNHLVNSPIEFFLNILRNNSLAFKSVFWIVLPLNKISLGSFTYVNKIINIFSPFIWIVIIGTFYYKLRRRSLNILNIFFVFYLVVLLLWSGYNSNPLMFARVCLPVFIFVIYYFYIILNKIFVKKGIVLFNVFVSVLIVLNVFCILKNINFNDDVLFQPENQQLFNWVKNNLKENEHYIFWQADVMALMTGRVGTVPWIYDPAIKPNIVKRIVDFDVKYLILNKVVDRLLIQTFEQNVIPSRLVWENNDYKVFEINKLEFETKFVR